MTKGRPQISITHGHCHEDLDNNYVRRSPIELQTKLARFIAQLQTMTEDVSTGSWRNFSGRSEMNFSGRTFQCFRAPIVARLFPICSRESPFKEIEYIVWVVDWAILSYYVSKNLLLLVLSPTVIGYNISICSHTKERKHWMQMNSNMYQGMYVWST
jgi:hypothetical protein